MADKQNMLLGSEETNILVAAILKAHLQDEPEAVEYLAGMVNNPDELSSVLAKSDQGKSAGKVNGAPFNHKKYFPFYYIKSVQGQRCGIGQNPEKDDCYLGDESGQEQQGQQEQQQTGPKLNPEGYPIEMTKEETESLNQEYGPKMLPKGKKPKVTLRGNFSDSDVKSDIKKFFGKEIDDDTIGAIANGVDKAKIRVSITVYGDTAELSIRWDDFGDEKMAATRTLHRDGKGKLSIHNDYFKINNDSPHKGKGVEFFVNQVNALREVGVSYIETFAAGHAFHETLNGYYAWPRMGYEGTMEDDTFANFPKDVQRKLGTSRSVLDLMDMKEINVTSEEKKEIQSVLKQLDDKEINDKLEKIYDEEVKQDKLRKWNEGAKRRSEKREKISGADCWKVYGRGLYDAKFDLSDGSRNMEVLLKYIEERKSRVLAKSDQGKSAGKVNGAPFNHKKYFPFYYIKSVQGQRCGVGQNPKKDDCYLGDESGQEQQGQQEQQQTGPKLNPEGYLIDKAENQKPSSKKSSYPMGGEDLSPLNEIPELKEPKSRKDMGQWLKEVKNHPYIKEAERLLAENREQTIDKYQKEDGSWDEQRVKEVHEPIINHFVNPKAKSPKGQKPILTMLIGPFGAGKTSVGGDIVKKQMSEYTLVNPDDIKSMMPEDTGWNATNLQEESSYLAKEIQRRALEEGHNILFDGSGRNSNNMVKMADLYSKRGYDIHVVHVTVPSHTSAYRAASRFLKNPFGKSNPDKHVSRYVPLDFVYHEVDGKPDDTYQILKDSGLVKSGHSYNNEVASGEDPKLLDHFGN